MSGSCVTVVVSLTVGMILTGGETSMGMSEEG